MIPREVTKVSIEAFMDMTQRIENEGKRFELVNGEVVEDRAGGTGGEHGEVAADFHFSAKYARHGTGGNVGLQRADIRRGDNVS